MTIAMSFIKKFEVADFPNNLRSLPFERWSALGPNVSCDLAQLLQSNAVLGEYIDLDTGENRAIDSKVDISESGDFFYCFFAPDETWFYIFYSDLEYGVLFQKLESSWPYGMDVIRIGEESFKESLRIRQGRDREYYDQKGLMEWAELLNS